MAFFDLHTHPSFKSSLLNDTVDLCPNPVDFVNIELKGPFSACLEKLAGNSLDSQTSFGQVAGGSVLVVSFIAFERVYSFVSDLKKIKNLGAHILQSMQDQEESYIDRLKGRELKHFLAFEEVASGPRKYKLLHSFSDYPNQPDPNTVYVVASIEGGHNFYANKDIARQEATPDDIVTQLGIWKTKSFQNPDAFPRLLYITMAHHGQNALANHAWAIPVQFAANTVNVGSFDPTGDGLSPTGEKFLRRALKEDASEKRILIDVKHLSLKTRKQVYTIMERDFPGTPILATHMGVTGTSWDQPPILNVHAMDGRPRNIAVSYNEIGGFLRKVPPTSPDPQSALTRIPFNPWSLNLYNEDIAHIMRSGGLIGIAMDRRILGATLTRKFVEEERFSRLEFPADWHSNMPTPFSLYPTTALPDGFSGGRGPAIEDLWSFCQQIIHIVLITEQSKSPTNPPELQVPATVDPWRHICLGSDYDGLITALKTSPSADKLGHLFRDDLKSCLIAMAQHLNTNPAVVNKIRVPNDVVERLSVQNGLDFLRKHFN